MRGVLVSELRGGLRGGQGFGVGYAELAHGDVSWRFAVAGSEWLSYRRVFE